MAHGALNTIVTLFDEPEEWRFKQFVSQEELDKFASDNNLVVAYKEK